MTLSKRLLATVKYLKGFNYLADCGTDHGYLPIYAIEHGLVQKAIASDNKEMPLKNALQNIEISNLSDKIETKLADGLPYLNQEIDIVSILGMGGRMISDILRNANIKYLKRLVLLANSDQNILREFLQNNNLKIVEEEIILDKGKFYQIIVAEPGEMNLSKIELEFGPIIIKSNTKIFKEYVSKLINTLEVAILRVKNQDKLEIIQKRIQILKEVIS
ncbi:class I SAM-dependent methyltransferase [Mycoplasmatota bacterium WC30]